jgi:FdhD protein
MERSTNPERTRTSQTRTFPVRKISTVGPVHTLDTVVIEEPLEIRTAFWFKEARITESIAVTMRTPGDEEELAAGFLLSEGVVRERDDIVEIRRLGPGDPCNELHVELAPHVDVENWRLRRSTLLSSACGLCGKKTLESIPESADTSCDSLRVQPGFIRALPALLDQHQRVFQSTGGLHGAALVTPGCGIEAAFEDIGRHNALDKLLGHCFLQGMLPLSRSLIFMTSRGSFELVQKTLAAGSPALATIGAPSSLAIELARSRGLTLVGFIRNDHFNVYAGEWRVDSN